jgi:hypothetical protein
MFSIASKRGGVKARTPGDRIAKTGAHLRVGALPVNLMGVRRDKFAYGRQPVSRVCQVVLDFGAWR